MKNNYVEGVIYSNNEISPNIFELVLERDFQGKPGQFYMVRGWEALDPFLSRPLSIADLENGKVKFLYEKRGRGTHIISKLRKGDTLDVLGPLGNGFDTQKEGKIAIITGGIGIAPILYLAKNLTGEINIYSGFRNNAYFLDQIRPFANNIVIATEDGLTGHKGFITELFQPKDYDLVFACGPTDMMKVVVGICKDIVPVYLSMESRMGCGIGTCLSCAVETTRGMERACKEGPVFKGEEVILHG